MWLFKWYVWNRWIFKLLSRDVAEPEHFLLHCWEENLAKCRGHMQPSGAILTAFTVDLSAGKEVNAGETLPPDGERVEL